MMTTTGNLFEAQYVNTINTLLRLHFILTLKYLLPFTYKFSGRARTGTGKTLSFCLPILEKLLALNYEKKRGKHFTSQFPSYARDYDN